jgi:Ser/Thr protein kinase RdoA (MazF antagonist)
MRQAAHDRLAATFDSYEPVRQLHDVPPHEVWEVRVDGQRAVYKGDTDATGKTATEGRVTAFVDAQTSVPVPTVLHVGADFYVAAWHPDAPVPDVEREATDEWCRAAGRTLATLHAESAPAVDGYGLPEPTDEGLVAPHDDWHAAAVAYVRARRPPLAAHGHADLADAVLDRLADRPDAFAGAGDAVCCHGWWTPEHVAVGAGEVRCVVDFEHALAAPAEFDYWRTALPTFLATGEDDGRETFREAYESVRPLPDGVERRREWFLLLCETYYVESLYVQDQHGPEETEQRAEWLRELVLDRVDGL